MRTGKTTRMLTVAMEHAQAGQRGYICCLYNQEDHMLAVIHQVAQDGNFDEPVSLVKAGRLVVKIGGGQLEFVRPTTRILAEGSMYESKNPVFADHFALEHTMAWALKEARRYNLPGEQ